MSETQKERREKTPESDSEENEGREETQASDTGGVNDERKQDPVEEGRGFRESLREIRRIELGSDVGRASVYYGMVMSFIVGVGGIQFRMTPDLVSLNTSLGTVSLGLLLFFFFCDVTLAYYFVPQMDN